MDLGIKNPPPDAPLKQSEPKLQYPAFTLRDEQVTKVKGEQRSLGEEYTATVRLKVSGMQDDEFGKRLTFDLVSMDGFAPAEGAPDAAEETPEEAPDDEPSEEEAFGYKVPKKSTKGVVPAPTKDYLTS